MCMFLVLLELEHMNHTVAIDTVECFSASYNGNQLVTVLTKILSSNHGNETKLASAKWYANMKVLNITCIPAIIVVCTMYIHVSLYNPFIVFSMELHMYNKHHHFLPLLCSFSFSLTYLCRAGAISSESPVVTLKVLPSLIRLCKRKLDMELRAEATGTLGKAAASYPGHGRRGLCRLIAASLLF